MKWSAFKKNFAAICRLQWKYNKSLAVYFVLLEITGKLKLYAGIYCAGAVLDADALNALAAGRLRRSS